MAGTVLAVTVFCFVLGSSSVPWLSTGGHRLRWVALCALLLIACFLVWRERRGRIGLPLLLVGGAGAWLAALAVVSTAWSAQPHLTFGRAGSFALLLLTAGLLALASRTRSRLPAALALGLLAAAVVAALIGVLMLAVAHADAVQPASPQAAARFRGLGMNPDTLPMLNGLALPIAWWGIVKARETLLRVLAVGSVVLLVVEIGASGSRGGMVALLSGGVVTALALPRRPRERLALALAVVLATAAAAGGASVAKPLPPTASYNLPGSSSAGIPSAVPGSSAGAPEPQYTGRLADELYRVNTGGRSLFSASGREQALWLGIHQGNARPALGYGFGTEDKVFIDRVYNFQGAFVENTFVGLYLQLGLVGVVSLLALLAAVIFHCVRIVRARRSVAPALAGIVAAGIALMFVQSYAYSVGNVATVAFWVACFAAAGVASLRAEESHVPS